MFIGLDLGTSGLKGVLINEAQQVLAEATAPLSVSRPQNGWSEQAPADWIAAAETVLDALACMVWARWRALAFRGRCTARRC
jgi:xylulokinase